MGCRALSGGTVGSRGVSKDMEGSAWGAWDQQCFIHTYHTDQHRRRCPCPCGGKAVSGPDLHGAHHDGAALLLLCPISALRVPPPGSSSAEVGHQVVPRRGTPPCGHRSLPRLGGFGPGRLVLGEGLGKEYSQVQHRSPGHITVCNRARRSVWGCAPPGGAGREQSSSRNGAGIPQGRC